MHVLHVDLDADIVEAHFVKAKRASTGADVTLAGERAERERVLQVAARQVVADGAVHVALSGKGGC